VIAGGDKRTALNVGASEQRANNTESRGWKEPRLGVGTKVERLSVAVSAFNPFFTVLAEKLWSFFLTRCWPGCVVERCLSWIDNADGGIGLVSLRQTENRGQPSRAQESEQGIP
jgi:hypothetical protein